MFFKVSLSINLLQSTAMSDTILTSLLGGLFTITLNNSQKHNCMGMEMLYALEAAIKEAQANSDIKVLVITGAGEKSFSTGANIKEFNLLRGNQINDWILEGNRIFNLIEQLPKPTIALLNGYTMGGGLELALCCDFRIGMNNTLIASPEVKNGWLPGWGAMTRLRRLVGEATAKRIILLSENIDAKAAIELGILTRIVDTNRMEEELHAFLDPLFSLDLETYSLAKSALMEDRSTTGSDLHFDVMAAHLAKSK